MNSQTSTCDLVNRFKRGDQAAFSLLFGKYRRRLAVLVYYKMSDELRGKLQGASWRGSRGLPTTQSRMLRVTSIATSAARKNYCRSSQKATQTEPNPWI